jgi:hypothetical protein
MTITAYIEPKVMRHIQPEVVTVSLAEFKLEDVAEFLRANGFAVDGTFSRALMDNVRSQRGEYCRQCHDDETVSGCLIEEDQLARVQTLAMCGQRDAAREYVLQIVGDYLGRSL